MVWLLTACVRNAAYDGKYWRAAWQSGDTNATLWCAINQWIVRPARSVISIILTHTARSHTDRPTLDAHTRTYRADHLFSFRVRCLIASHANDSSSKVDVWHSNGRRTWRRRTLRKRLRRARDAKCHFICVEPPNASPWWWISWEFFWYARTCGVDAKPPLRC